ncbi:UDP-N-acetylglucosamine 1-carboxyvinyltransferase [Candidatus Uhrbacteria bacterium]|nr:UDP-N-acetylglucosamine 1-carboxyvinyltransferase [Candidatus Uhrbacteria bacterium]
MELFRVEGGQPVKGSVEVSGAKNAASKMMIASLLTEESVVLENVPRHRETTITQEIVESVGARALWQDHTLSLETRSVPSGEVRGLSAKNRISILAIAPLLHRVGEAFVPVVDGDRIGKRPVQWHIEALRAMGAEVEERPDGYRARAPRPLQGALIDLPYPSVGATETGILAGVLAKGRTVIRNAAVEPEILELIKMLQKMGAIIEVGAGRVVEIVGVERLGGCVMKVMPDPLEAASFACIALATKGDVFVKGAVHEHLMTFLNTVRRIGGLFDIREDGIRFWTERPLSSIKLETDTYPGFRTDWQAPFAVVLTQATGTSIVHETVYESRFGYTETLNRMGADVTLFSNCLGEISCRFRGGNSKHSAVINGPTALRADEIQIPDIRAGLAFVVAALVAEGTSILRGVEHLDRGYERLEEKLLDIGVRLTRESVS